MPLLRGWGAMELNWVMAFWLALSAGLAATAGISVMMLGGVRQARRGSAFLADVGRGTGFLFDGETLLDSTPGARALLKGDHLRGGPWARMLAALSRPFPDLERQLARLAQDGRITLLSSEEGRDGPLVLEAEQRGGLTRITLLASADAEGGLRPGAEDPLLRQTMTTEIAQLRKALSCAPVLAWRERADGEVIWSNTAYLLRASDRLDPGQDLAWPLPRLFERTATAQAATGQRQRLDLPGGEVSWYEVTSHPDGEGRLNFALPVDGAVQAEGALRDFMQTLTKTFAHLPIGLAIFDKNRQLQLFNPALLDLTGLPPDMLSLRPSLHAVLDALRDRNMIPEPKDYRGWRRQIVEMEQAAAKGLYEETWSLPGGETYRVTGRPHPNGALALLFEDITTEMSRTRRYRADLELGQSVIDEIGEAVAVFSAAGHLVMSNTAYAMLWGHDPATSLGDAGVRSLAQHWRSQSAPSPLWTDVEEFVATMGDRRPWTAEARLLDGRLVSCRFAPLAAGATLAAFRLTGPESSPLRLSEAMRRSGTTGA
jgi:PAS domain-containing protein